MDVLHWLRRGLLVGWLRARDETGDLMVQVSRLRDWLIPEICKHNLTFCESNPARHTDDVVRRGKWVSPGRCSHRPNVGGSDMICYDMTRHGHLFCQSVGLALMKLLIIESYIEVFTPDDLLISR